MAKGQLTDAFIRSASEGRYQDGAGYGLVLIVVRGADGNLRKRWGQRLRQNGRRVELGLGSYPLIGLAKAREVAIDNARKAAAGADLVAARRRPKVPTFEQAARAYMASMMGTFRSAKHAAQWPSTLARYAYPKIGHRRVDDITTADVLAVLKPIWIEKAETAARLRGRLEAVFGWCIAQGFRDGSNPAAWKGNLAALLPSPAKLRAKSGRHHPAVQQADARRWYQAVASRPGFGARCLQFVALTGCRSGEARAATWAMIDLDKGIWTKPASITKAGIEHRVPLPVAALDLLRGLDRLAGSDIVFPAPKGGQLSDMALSAVQRRIHGDAIAAGGVGYLDKDGRPAVVHGLRSLLRDWCADNGVDRDIAETMLGHVVARGTEAAYWRSDVLERRRVVAERYAAWITGRDGAVVVPLRIGGA